MGSRYSPNPVLAAKIRKQFNKQHVNFTCGDLVRTLDGKIGEYQGISTFAHPSRIEVTLYKTNVDNLEERVVYELPETFVFGRQEIPVNLNIQERPEIVPPEDIEIRKRLRLPHEQLYGGGFY